MTAGAVISSRYIDDATRLRLEKLIDLRARLNQSSAKRKDFDNEVERIEAYQKRLRENIESLTKTAEARALPWSYIAKAGEQETRLEEMEKERKTKTLNQDQFKKELADEIKNFEVR